MKKPIGRPHKVINSDTVKTVKRIITNSELIDNLLIQESIIRNVPIAHVVTDIFTAHFTNNTLQMKYLRAILTELTRKRGKAISDELLNLNAFDKLLISENEIKASRYTAKRKYKKKYVEDTSEKPQEKIDIFDLATIKNPLT
jgi:hypothetical protein